VPRPPQPEAVPQAPPARPEPVTPAPPATPTNGHGNDRFYAQDFVAAAPTMTVMQPTPTAPPRTEPLVMPVSIPQQQTVVTFPVAPTLDAAPHPAAATTAPPAEPRPSMAQTQPAAVTQAKTATRPGRLKRLPIAAILEVIAVLLVLVFILARLS
jgi:hypothetical protein